MSERNQYNENSTDKILSSWDRIEKAKAPDDLHIHKPVRTYKLNEYIKWAAVLLLIAVNLSVWYMTSSKGSSSNSIELISDYSDLSTFETEIIFEDEK